MTEFFDLTTTKTLKRGTREYTFRKEQQRYYASDGPRHTIILRRWDNQTYGVDQTISFPLEDLDAIIEKLVELRNAPSHDAEAVRAAIRHLEGMLPDAK